MKLFLIGLVTAIAVVGLSACCGGVKGDNLGYPERLVISKEGENLQVKGDAWIDLFEITDDREDGGTQALDMGRVGNDSIKIRIYSYGEYAIANGDFVIGVNDTIEIQYNWLKAARFNHGNDILLKAEPNLTGKSRKLRVSGINGPDNMDIWIEQKGK